MASTNLTDRLVPEIPESEPEDFLSSSLAVIFPDAVANQHGDPDTTLLYTSPSLPRPLRIELADPSADEDRLLFGHYLWNASLLAAEFIDAGTTLPPPADTETDPDAIQQQQQRWGPQPGGDGPRLSPPSTYFNIAGKSTIELGAGTALPSMMAALLGAASVTITDYPSPALLDTLRRNVAHNVVPANAGPRAAGPFCHDVLVEGHAWGEMDEFARGKRHAYDVVIAADCLWMPWQHTNLHTSIAHFLKPATPAAPDARAWVIAGFHTGRSQMRGFFDPDALAAHALQLERIWEVDCLGNERAWVPEREGEDATGARRWLAVGIVKSVAEA